MPFTWNGNKNTGRKISNQENPLNRGAILEFYGVVAVFSFLDVLRITDPIGDH